MHPRTTPMESIVSDDRAGSSGTRAGRERSARTLHQPSAWEIVFAFKSAMNRRDER